jgi:hypothetical protein
MSDALGAAVSKAERCPTTVLSDSPTTDDSFGHKAVAHAIADLITTTVGGKAVALTGSWGSGKSSVIEILASELRSTNDAATETLVFDAWAHQGDPLRRSFLQQLVQQLAGCGWLRRKDYWSERISELARRLQKVSIKSTPALTVWGGLFAVLLLLAPAGLQLFSKYDSQKFNHPRWAAAGFGLALLPFAFGVLAFLWLRPTWKVWQKRFWTTNRGRYEGSTVLGLLLNKIQEKSESSTVQTPEPTSIEFQQFFRDVLEEALADRNRKLLVVIDNLDRVDAEDAREIWATLKAFFDFGAQTGTGWLTRLWLVVPFDSSALKRLWKDNEAAVGTAEAPPQASDGLADSFADKTFQVTFRVSPPVLSDWQAFFETQLRVAFPVNHEKEFHSVYRIYDLKRLAASRPPTPRDIKLFINRVGAIHRQWQDRISLPLQALYVLLLREFPHLEAELTRRDEDILKTVPLQLVGSEWRKAIAAIHFNVPPDKALQIAIGEPVRAALVGGNAEELRSLQQVEGFEPVLERIVEQNYNSWATGESKSLALAALAVAGVKADENPSYAQTWKWLREGAQNVSSWGQLDPKIAEGVVQIFRYRPDQDLASKIIGSASRSLPEAQKEEILAASVIEPWLGGVAVILKQLGEQFGVIAAKQFCIQGSVGNYTQILSVASAKPDLKPILHFFQPAVTREDVIAKLGTDCVVGTFDDSRTDTVGAMLVVDGTWPWPTLIKAFESKLRTPGQVQAPELRSMLRASLDIARTEDGANQMLRRLANDGFLANHMWYSRQAGQKDAVALCLLPWIENTQGFALPGSPGQANNGLTVFRQLIQSPEGDPDNLQLCADLFVQYERIEHLYDIYATFPGSKDFIAAVLNRIAERENSQDLVPARRITDSYRLLKEALPSASLKTLVAKSTEKSGLRDEVMSRAFRGELAELYLEMLQCSGGHEEFKKFLLGGLRPLHKDNWFAQLTSEGPLLEIALNLASDASRSGTDLGLTTEFQDALCEHAEKLTSGTAVPSKLRDSWAMTSFVLTRSSREAFQFRLSELLCESEAPTDPVLDLYGKDLACSPALLKNRERLILLGFSKMIDRKRRTELEWIADVLSNAPEIVSSSSRDDFEERMKKLRQEVSDDALRPAIERISSALGLKK